MRSKQSEILRLILSPYPQLEYLVSWNFKHLVNVEREKGFNAVNLLPGDRPIRNVNRLELIYGHQDQSL